MHAARMRPLPWGHHGRRHRAGAESPSLLIQCLLQNRAHHLSQQSQLHKAPTLAKENKNAQVSVPPFRN